MLKRLRLLGGRLATKAFWHDALERAAVNSVQAVAALGIVTAGMTLGNVDWVTITGVGLAAGGASVLLSIVSMPGEDAGIPLWQAVFWRAVRTFSTVLAAVLGADAVNVFELNWSHVLSAAVVTTLIAVGKNLLVPPIESVNSPLKATVLS
jgi:hypothetical protein